MSNPFKSSNWNWFLNSSSLKPKLLEYHGLSMYKWLSNAKYSYLLYYSPKDFGESKSTMNLARIMSNRLWINWVLICEIRSVSYVFMEVYALKKKVFP